MKRTMLLALTTISVTFAVPALTFAQNPPGAAVALDSVTLDEDTLRVHFIDIGGGLAVLVETPGGKHLLIDGGKVGIDDYKAYLAHFIDTGTVDYLVVTHADDDHFLNMKKVILDFNVGEYWNTRCKGR